MPMTIGPPARPSFTGRLMPGMLTGMLPSTSPRISPTKTATRLGSSRFLTALPRIFSTFWIAAASPTTVRRSPIWSRRSGVASSCTPER